MDTCRNFIVNFKVTQQKGLLRSQRENTYFLQKNENELFFHSKSVIKTENSINKNINAITEENEYQPRISSF